MHSINNPLKREIAKLKTSDGAETKCPLGGALLFFFDLKGEKLTSDVL